MTNDIDLTADDPQTAFEAFRHVVRDGLHKLQNDHIGVRGEGCEIVLHPKTYSEIRYEVPTRRLDPTEAVSETACGATIKTTHEVDEGMIHITHPGNRVAVSRHLEEGR